VELGETQHNKKSDSKSERMSRRRLMVHFESQVSFPLCSVYSVYSVVPAFEGITTEHPEGTERKLSAYGPTLKSKLSRNSSRTINDWFSRKDAKPQSS